ncbi:MAG: hypothetical protein ACK56F_27785, partial [bacterium]
AAAGDRFNTHSKTVVMAHVHLLVEVEMLFLQVKSTNSGDLSMESLGGEVFHQLPHQHIFHFRLIKVVRGQTF